MGELRNLTSQEELKKRLAGDGEARKTLSFYQYHTIENPREFRDEMYEKLENLGVLGRIYVAREGINAQMSVPEKNFEAFKDYLYSIDFLNGVRLNIAVEDDGKSFWVLNVKVRKKIVADGIEDPSFNMETRGEYLNAEEFNRLTENPKPSSWICEIITSLKSGILKTLWKFLQILSANSFRWRSRCSPTKKTEI